MNDTLYPGPLDPPPSPDEPEPEPAPAVPVAPGYEGPPDPDIAY